MTDWRVYCIKERTETGKNGKSSAVYDIAPSGEMLPDAAIAAFSAFVPDAADITVYDFPCMCEIVFRTHIGKNASADEYWFIRYFVPDDAFRLGCGNVMIMERKTGSVVYNGDDDGE